jgi:ABC-type transporter Mla maintaining outer membrane lipid asymmetry permease subunit MlaE
MPIIRASRSLSDQLDQPSPRRRARPTFAGDGDRGYGSFLRSIRHQPGFTLKLIVVACLCAGDLLTMSLTTALETIAAAILVVFGLGYLFWRRFGPVYDRRR